VKLDSNHILGKMEIVQGTITSEIDIGWVGFFPVGHHVLKSFPEVL